jgi:hypothetical protein
MIKTRAETVAIIHGPDTLTLVKPMSCQKKVPWSLGSSQPDFKSVNFHSNLFIQNIEGGTGPITLIILPTAYPSRNKKLPKWEIIKCLINHAESLGFINGYQKSNTWVYVFFWRWWWKQVMCNWVQWRRQWWAGLQDEDLTTHLQLNGLHGPGPCT